MFTSKMVALLVALVGCLVAWQLPAFWRPSRVSPPPPTTTIAAVACRLSWEALQRARPRKPCRITGSPQQRWLATASDSLWTPLRMLELTQDPHSEAGRAVVNLKSLDLAASGAGARRSFTHHHVSAAATAPTTHATFDIASVSLHDALRKIWPQHASATVVPRDSKVYYLSPDMLAMPPALLPYDHETLLTFIPEGCLADDMRHRDRALELEPVLCRGLAATMWLGQDGAVSAAVHYDLQHNVFLQASGRKRFSLLPPGSHRTVQLHPRWHGSQRQGQIHLPSLTPTPPEVIVAELGPGDMLYVPPLWFHYVESLVAGVAANFWTDSLASDTWLQLTNRSAEDSDSAGNWDGLLDLIDGNVLVGGAAVIRLVVNKTSAVHVAERYAGFDQNCGVIKARCNAQRPQIKLGEIARAVLREYAAALRAVEEGPRSLLLAEWVDEFSGFVLKRADLPVTCVPAFLKRCAFFNSG